MSPYLEVRGKSFLSGEVKISGAKNSALVLMAASLLTEDPVIIDNVPNLTDIDGMSDLIRSTGTEIKRSFNTLKINTKHLSNTTLPKKAVHALRASFVCIGPLLARFGEVKIPLPGGCQIGARPIDEHIKGLRLLGADVKIRQGVIHAALNSSRKRLKGANIHFQCRSVGATQTLLMAASLAEGTTILENAAQEPEVQDLANMLNTMGAKIKGAGTPQITIKGINKLKGCRYKAIPDRIEAGTFLIAAALTRSPLFVSPIIPEHLESVLAKLDECGCKVIIENQGIRLIPQNIKSVDITTEPFPGFPTDLQAPFMALMATAKGTSKIKETVFERRMQHVHELKKMGARISLKENVAEVTGVSQLLGASLLGGDLRSTAAMILASLSVEGVSKIEGLNHLDRGYESIESKFNQIGVSITRHSESSNFQKLMNKNLRSETTRQEVA